MLAILYARSVGVRVQQKLLYHCMNDADSPFADNSDDRELRQLLMFFKIQITELEEYIIGLVGGQLDKTLL